MEIVRTEEGTFTRKITLKVDEPLIGLINKDLEDALVEGECKPLTIEDIWDIMYELDEARRYNEEYHLKMKFRDGNMKLGDFVRYEINCFFEELPGEIDNETIDVYTDEFYP